MIGGNRSQAVATLPHNNYHKMDRELTNHGTFRQSLRKAIVELFDYCRDNDFSGYDPYDGLNGRIFARIPFFQNNLGRLVFIQLMKRSPVNFRAILGVPKEPNPKGLALFTSALIDLERLGIVEGVVPVLPVLNRLVESRTRGTPHACWGYNFDWQSRFTLIPKYTPNVICTTFAGNALVDAYERSGDPTLLDLAMSAGDFILNGLLISEFKEGICFSYTPHYRSLVHNANLLAAAYLGRIHKVTGKGQYLEPASKAVAYSVSRQEKDGSWPYGEDSSQRWIDGFHTGYNLCALHRYSQYVQDPSYNENMISGFRYYLDHFFNTDGSLNYYNNRKYPIDIHSISQAINTLVELYGLTGNHRELAQAVCRWGLKNMKDEKGFFYYQKRKFYTNRIPYMRWSQAWMLNALVNLENALSDPN